MVECGRLHSFSRDDHEFLTVLPIAPVPKPPGIADPVRLHRLVAHQSDQVRCKQLGSCCVICRCWIERDSRPWLLRGSKGGRMKPNQKDNCKQVLISHEINL